jgi:hypothetical protein
MGGTTRNPKFASRHEQQQFIFYTASTSNLSSRYRKLFPDSKAARS